MTKTRSFVDDLSDYLLEESEDEWDQLRENYPHKFLGDGRYEFLPQSSDLVDPEEHSRYIVRAPEGYIVDERSGTELIDKASDYIGEENAVEKLMILAEIQEELDESEVDGYNAFLGSDTGIGIQLGPPSLSEIAETYNSEELDYPEDDKEILTRIASETSKTFGNGEKTIYLRDNEIMVCEDGKEELYMADNLSDCLSLSEAFSTWEFLWEHGDDDALNYFRDMFDSYEGGQLTTQYKFLIDREDGTAVIFDMDTVEITELKLEDTGNWFDRKDENFMEMVEELYEGLK